MTNYNQDAVWYGTYFMVAFFILRFYVVHFNLGSGDELAYSGWAALGGVIIAPVYYFFRDKLVITKMIPLVIMVAIGVGVSFLI
jgi:multidrug transporter EmrE-like cation transporter